MNVSKELQIEEMDSIRVARVSVECENPEVAAFKALAEWVSRNEPEPLKNVRFFGFNDPCPEPGQAVYRYEAWMTVSDKARQEGDVGVMLHPARKYAVLTTPLSEIGESWDRLVEVVKASEYDIDSGPALEEALGNPLETPFDKAVMKLYLPVH